MGISGVGPVGGLGGFGVDFGDSFVGVELDCVGL